MPRHYWSSITSLSCDKSNWNRCHWSERLRRTMQSAVSGHNSSNATFGLYVASSWVAMIFLLIKLDKMFNPIHRAAQAEEEYFLLSVSTRRTWAPMTFPSLFRNLISIVVTQRFLGYSVKRHTFVSLFQLCEQEWYQWNIYFQNFKNRDVSTQSRHSNSWLKDHSRHSIIRWAEE